MHAKAKKTRTGCLEGLDIKMVVIFSKEVAYEMKRKKSLVDFVILHNASPGRIWQEPKFLLLVDL